MGGVPAPGIGGIPPLLLQPVGWVRATAAVGLGIGATTALAEVDAEVPLEADDDTAAEADADPLAESAVDPLEHPDAASRTTAPHNATAPVPRT